MSTPAVTPFDVRGFLSDLRCPKSSAFLTDALHFHPCAHRVNETVVRRLLDSFPSGSFPCPICGRRVERYYPDQMVRGLAEKALAWSSSNRAAFLAAVATEEPPFNQRIEYPGNRAIFTLEPGAWKVYRSGGLLIRAMTFKTRTPDPFLNEISLLGYRDGSLALSIKAAPEKEQVLRKFLSDVGFPQEERMEGAFRLFSDSVEFRKIYRILVAYNEFERGNLDRLGEFVQACDWRIVTPLTEEDRSALAHSAFAGFDVEGLF